MNTRMWIDGQWVDGDAGTASLEQKYTGEVLAEVAQASPDQIVQAVGSLHEAARREVIPPYRRFEILSRASAMVAERRDQLRDLIVAESGFTRGDADGEITRATQTLRLSAEEATRLAGEMVPLEGAPGVSGRLGFTMRYPVGVVCAITPFNSPLNTVSHKVGPAIAAGNAVVLKPATATPLTASALVEILLEAGLPPRHIALVHGGGKEVGTALLEDERIGFYTFTGSTEVGRIIQQSVGLRRTQLELGSLSSTIVCADADLDTAVERCVSASFRKAGQVCTSVQRLYVDEAVSEAFEERLLDAMRDLEVGDPSDPATFVGPLISEPEAIRVESWVQGAADAGARVLAGGQRDGRVVAPTLLTDVGSDMQVMCNEVFGPVVSLRAYHELDATIDEINDTPYGLAAGIFTQDIGVALTAAERLRMGSVHVNQTSSSRVDLMPYGGVKDSGFGHEGPKYAAREMTEERLVTITYA
jgi:acyl-CoA reductase-like NAD-dependent aldehyde dehydrogenase